MSARGCDMQQIPNGLTEEVVKHTSWIAGTFGARSARKAPPESAGVRRLQSSQIDFPAA